MFLKTKNKKNPTNSVSQNHSQNNFFWELFLVLCFWKLCSNKGQENLIPSATVPLVSPADTATAVAGSSSSWQPGCWSEVFGQHVPEWSWTQGKGDGTQGSGLDLIHESPQGHPPSHLQTSIPRSCSESSNKSCWIQRMLISTKTPL